MSVLSILSLLILVVSTSFLVLFDTANVGQTADPVLGDLTEAWAAELADLLRDINRLALGLFMWTLIDATCLTWINLRDVVLGTNGWHTREMHVRAGFVLGWFIAFAAVVVAAS